MVGIGLYQGYRGLSKDFLDDSKTEQMSSRRAAAIERLGVVGHLARMVVFGLIGVFLIKAAVDYNPNEAVGLDGALAKLVAPPLRARPARHRRRRPDRIRALLAERRALPQSLSASPKTARVCAAGGGAALRRCPMRCS